MFSLGRTTSKYHSNYADCVHGVNWVTGGYIPTAGELGVIVEYRLPASSAPLTCYIIIGFVLCSLGLRSYGWMSGSSSLSTDCSLCLILIAHHSLLVLLDSASCADLVFCTAFNFYCILLQDTHHLYIYFRSFNIKVDWSPIIDIERMDRRGTSTWWNGRLF